MAISAVGGSLFYPHNRLYRTRHSVCREDVDTEIQHCYSSSFSFAFLTVSIFYQKRCPIKRTLVMTASGHYSEIVLSDGEIALLGSGGREDSLQNDKQKFPINLIRYANQSVGYKTKMHQSLTGHLMHFVYLTIFSNYGRWYTTNLNFPFSIFNFQLKNNARAIVFELSQTVFTNRAQRHAAGDSPLFKCFHTLLECFDYIPCFIVCES